MGDRATVTFEWNHRPEWVKEGTRVIFREGRTKGVGVVRKAAGGTEDAADQLQERQEGRGGGK